MNKKHQAELTAVAEKIYDLAANEIQAYINKTYGKNQEAFYGIAGRNYIEVHHVVPLSDIAEDVLVNPATDLVCLCSNCHRIVHRKGNGIYSIDEVKKMISDNSAKVSNG